MHASRNSISLIVPSAPSARAPPRPRCRARALDAGGRPEHRLGRLLARPQGGMHGAVLDRLGRLAGEEHPVAERPRMVVAILGRAADRRVGIAAARPRIAQPARKERRPPARARRCRTSCAATPSATLLHLVIVAVAVEAQRRCAPLAKLSRIGSPVSLLRGDTQVLKVPRRSGASGRRPNHFGCVRPEAVRKAQIDLAQDARAIADAADRLLLLGRRQRIERRHAGAQQADAARRSRRGRPRSSRRLAGSPSTPASLQTTRSTGAPRRTSSPRAASSISATKPPLRLGVALEPFGRQPFLRRRPRRRARPARPRCLRRRSRPRACRSRAATTRAAADRPPP